MTHVSPAASLGTALRFWSDGGSASSRFLRRQLCRRGRRSCARDRAKWFNNPAIKLAALGDLQFDKLPGASDPAYLGETPEVTLTPAIRAKAHELNDNPVQIYNWVRNNVEWLPTWGAAQDAEITLGSLRGNAMDIASLLIALYRAAGIPARYVHGTIEVPADKFMNWAGGFTHITAAVDYTSAGGIPVTTIVSGGQITQVRLEHIWVEAAIDFQPSRGAINKSADSWVALDPSFKQYQDLQGLDVVSIAGLDPKALAESFSNSGTVNTAEGWVSGLNATILTDAQTQAQTALQSHIESMTDPTVGDVIGGRRIVAQEASVLPTSLPARRLVTGARYATLPASLQNTYGLGFGIDILGDVNLVASFPFARVNNHKLTLSFRPATAADEETLASLLPDDITDPSQLPSSIPSYLITVVPEIALDGQIVGQGSAMRLGEDLELVFQVSQVGHTSLVKTYKIPAGAYLSLSAVQGGVSPKALQSVQAKLGQTKSSLESGDPSLIGSLSREEIIGDVFGAGTLSYWGQYIATAHVVALAQSTKHNLAAGFGSLGYEPHVDYFFGFPRAIKTGGVALNIWVADVTADTDGHDEKRRAFQLQVGMLSSTLEHAIPEQMFSTPTQPAEAVSAIKALQLAQVQGQRIYHITPANQGVAVPNLRLDTLALNEITEALAAGKEVITHTDRISVPGWTGEGYILFDPTTGAGAYKIAGGANGSWYTLLGVATGALMSVLAISFTFVKINPILFLAAMYTLMALFVLEMALAFAYGGEVSTYWSEIGYVSAIPGLLLGAKWFIRILQLIGPASMIPWVAATVIAFIVLLGLLTLLPRLLSIPSRREGRYV